MDQVKEYLQLLKKHHFWVLSGISAIVALVCWWMSANKLAAETAANKETIKGSWGKVDGASKKSNPPNEEFEKGVQEKDGELKKKVFAEWTQQYDIQKQLFQWPAAYLLQGMNERLASDRPIDEVDRQYFRSNDIFLKELKDLVFEVAQYRHWPEVEGEDQEAALAGAPKPPDDPNAPPPEIQGLVVWDPAHREQLISRYRLTQTPTDRSIRLAQEDMWMLQNMAQVIRKTNEGALDIIAAPIKKINSLDVAQWAINAAVQATPKVVMAASPAGGAADPMMAAPPVAAAAPPSPTGTPGQPGAVDTKAADDELLAGRYLNEQGQPLGAADAQPYAELKLLLVRMDIVIDQRKIPDFLALCANATIPIEITRITVEPLAGQQQIGASLGGGGAASGGRFGSGGMGGNVMNRFGGEGRGGFGGQQAHGGADAGKAAGDPTVMEPTVWDVNLEVCGLVQIYNLPDETKLGTGSSAEPGKRPSGVPTAMVIAPRGTVNNGPGGGPGGGVMRGRLEGR